jgi:hypothetical protein
VLANQRIGIDQALGYRHMQQARIGQYEHGEIHRGFRSADHDAPQLAAIDLALFARYHIQYRFIVTGLFEADLLV